MHQEESLSTISSGDSPAVDPNVLALFQTDALAVLDFLQRVWADRSQFAGFSALRRDLSLPRSFELEMVGLLLVGIFEGTQEEYPFLGVPSLAEAFRLLRDRIANEPETFFGNQEPSKPALAAWNACHLSVAPRTELGDVFIDLPRTDEFVDPLAEILWKLRDDT